MDKHIPLTIAIPTYKRCKSVVSLVKSILPQLHEEDELLVVDDGSEDGTTQALSTVARVRLVSNSFNQGMIKTWNKCLTSASHEWICIIHDDDKIASDALQTIQKACTLAYEPALIGPSNVFIKPNSLDVALDNCFRCQLVEPGAWAVLNAFPIPSGVTIHKSIIDVVGLFNEQFNYSTDLEYFARISAKFTSIRIENPPILFFNLHDQNYEYKTWEKPDFLTQLEEIERLVVTYSGKPEDIALHHFHQRMNRHIAYMLRNSSNAEDKTLLKKVGLTVRSKPYLWRRNRINAHLAALLNRHFSLLEYLFSLKD